MLYSKYSKQLALGMVFTFTPLSQAIAQQAANEVATSTNLEEIVITARKRDESLADVPLSVDAFSSEKLKESGIAELETLASFTPNLDFQNVGNTQPGRWNSGIRFRGMEVDISTPTNQTGGFFVDGVPVLGGASSIAFSDIASVEVIRGPQPVYFGRGTFGGAINYTTVTPGSEFAGEINGSYSPTFGSNDFTAWVEGGSEAISARLTGFSRTVASAFDSSDGGELGEENTRGVSAIVAINPTDRLRIKSRLAYSEDDDKSPSASMIPYTQLSDDGSPSFTGTVPYSESFLTRNTDFYTDPTFGNGLDFINQVDNGGAPDLDQYGIKAELTTFSLAVDYDLSDTFTLSALYGKSKKETGNLRDSDQYFAEGWITKSYLLHDTESIEARIAYDNGGRWRGIFGISQVEIDQDGDVDGGYNFFPNFASFPIVGFGISNRELQSIKTQGVFAGVELDILNNLTASVEARYQDEDNVSLQEEHLGEPENNREQTNLASKSVLPRLSLSYKPLETITAYISYAEGELPGTQQSEPNLPAQYPQLLDEQGLETIEIGWKQSLLQDAMFFSLTYFTQEWSNMIANETLLNDDNSPIQALIPGTSTQEGVELLLTWNLTQNLSTVLAYGYTESQYDDYTKDGFDFKGFTMPRSPKTSGSFGLTWQDELFADWSYTVRGDLLYRGDIFANEQNTVKIAGYNLFNLRANFSNESLNVGLYCSNCANEAAWATGTQATDFVTFSQGVIVDPITPREIGITAGYKF